MHIRALNPFSYSFPNPRYADDEGLLAYGGDLSASRLMSAYRHGIFPWYNEGDPILWWSPNPRMVLKLDAFKVSKSLAKTLKNNPFEIRFDTNFKETIKQCGKIKRNYTDHSWIQPEIIEAYNELFTLGYAHSFEAYLDDELVGGGYGVVIGDIFCGESMFAKKSNASKVALYYLIERLKAKGFWLIDCQVPSDHLRSLGAQNIKRDNFLDLIARALQNPREF